MRLLSPPLPETAEEKQRGINMVDLMMWLVIAALLLAAAIQSIGYYQKASFAYQAKNDVSNVQTWAAARVAVDGRVPSTDDMNAALTSGDLKLTKNGTTTNTPMIAVQGDKYCVGVQSSVLTGSNVFYSSSDSPSNILQDTSIPAACGTVTSGATATAIPTSTATATTTATPTPTSTGPTFTSITWSTNKLAVSSVTRGLLSGDGNTIVVTVGNGSSNPTISHNGGSTWTTAATLPSGKNYQSAAVSSDGKTILTTYLDSSNYSGLYVSKDGGSTWTLQTTPAKPWANFAMSADGTKMIAAESGGQGMYYTNNSGSTWTQMTASYTSVAISRDGSVIVGWGSASYSVSRDGGATWKTYSPAGGGVGDIGLSADGSKMYITFGTAGISVSTDFGATRVALANVPKSSTTLWNSVATSSDGTKIIASAFQGSGYIGSIATSTDSGTTWATQANSSNHNWTNAGISTDGTKMTAIDTSGNFWYGTYN